jgi:hypothetical protein
LVHFVGWVVGIATRDKSVICFAFASTTYTYRFRILQLKVLKDAYSTGNTIGYEIANQFQWELNPDATNPGSRSACKLDRHIRNAGEHRLSGGVDVAGQLVRALGDLQAVLFGTRSR